MMICSLSVLWMVIFLASSHCSSVRDTAIKYNQNCYQTSPISSSIASAIEEDQDTNRDNDFQPYADHGGTVVGLAGPDYVLLAADTRLSDNYMIRSRNITRIFELQEGLLLSGSGCWADLVALSKRLQVQVLRYRWEYKRHMSLQALSNLVAFELYSRRFFPYFSFCAVAGLDKKGCGAVYRYDAVGSAERVLVTCAGKGERMIQPLLDRLLTTHKSDAQLAASNEIIWQLEDRGDLSFEVHYRSQSSNTADSVSPLCVHINEADACDVVLHAFRAAAEREISVGDGLDIWILRRRRSDSAAEEGVHYSTTAHGQSKFTLRKLHFPLPQH